MTEYPRAAPPKARPPSEPGPNCDLCPRLRNFILDNRQAFPDWHNAPVATWFPSGGPGSAQLLIVGLAPGLRGANRTGIPFTGDYSGQLLFETLARHGMAEALPPDGKGIPHLKNTAITNAVRCVPPQNRPSATEINSCRPFLTAAIARMNRLGVIVTLGRISHDSTIRALGGNLSEHPFGHGNRTRIGNIAIIASYHCSRYNVNTGRLTPEMFSLVFAEAANLLARDR